MNNMKAVINELNKSILFQLSLGSKELFHSNFLAWLAENSLAFNQAILDFLGRKSCCIQSTTIYREKEHIDLWLEYEIQEDKNTKIVKVFVENKVKSLPYRSQLDSYAENQESAKKENIENHYILLSLYKPSFVDHNNCYVSELENDKSVKWHYLSYAELADRLTNSVVGEFEDNDYAALIIDDYIKFIHELNSLGDDIRKSVKKTFFLSHSDPDWDMFHGIRMGDFYEKLRYAILAEHLYDELVNKQGYKNVIMGVNPGTCQDNELGNNYQDAIYIDTGMSHTNGLIDVKIILNPKHPQSRKVIGIQIQDGQLRRLVETNAKDKAIDVVKGKTIIKDWFIGNGGNFNAGPNVKKNIDGEESRYHSFKESFVYRREEMQTYSLDDLISRIIKEINEIQNIKEYVLS